MGKIHLRTNHKVTGALPSFYQLACGPKTWLDGRVAGKEDSVMESLRADVWDTRISRDWQNNWACRHCMARTFQDVLKPVSPGYLK